ncbi:hypothetical protein KGD82_13370 [Nocardiopsis eucommiae]|uniref:Uncharacterized protein n=1 Tax=Nocardiopsis eucommiae TaxID=2831970 RepID=A0A975QM29_9ACTN|nr:hypothetical protein KGD82_13370 [Nocardiopsis eucommiae]
MDNASFAALMEGAGFSDPLADLWEIALLDTDPEPTVIDPAMEALAARDIASGDLLARPAFTPEVPGSLWSETEAVSDRFFGDLLAGPEPQTDREDRTVREHDETTQDWSRAAEGDDQ